MWNQDLRKELILLRDQDKKSIDLYHSSNKKEGSKIARKVEKRFKEIVEEYGWPTFSLVGKHVEKKSWIMAQHIDKDPIFQKKCISLIRKAAKNNDADQRHVGFLIDRILIKQKKKQLYGTQYKVDSKNKTVEAFPIANEKKINERREKLGMGKFVRHRVY